MKKEQAHTHPGHAIRATVLEPLFKRAYGKIEYRLLKDGYRPKCLWLDPGEELPQWVEKWNRDGFDIYFGVCTRKGAGGGAADDLLEVTAAWVDLDGKDFDAIDHVRGKQLAWDNSQAIIRAEGVPVPSIVVDTGHGWHLYWLYSGPLVIGDRARYFEAVNIALKEALGGDHVQDIARIMRLPGTVNMKYPDHPVSCRAVHIDPTRRYHPDHFAEMAAPWIAVNPPRVLGAIGGLQPHRCGDLRTLPAWAQRLVKEGWQLDGRYRSRSEAEFAALGVMDRKGWTFEQVLGVFCREDCAIGERFRERCEIRGQVKGIGDLVKEFEKVHQQL